MRDMLTHYDTQRHDTSKVIIVVATYNERENIERLLPELTSLSIQPKIVVVDDASPDGTGMIVKDLALPSVHLIERQTRLGYGSAFICGFQKALELGAEVIVSMDADYSHNPQSIEAMTNQLEGCDIVIGSRYLGGIRIINWPMHRLLLSSFANFYVRKILGFSVFDCTSGFRVYRSEALRAIKLNGIKAQGYAFLVELLENLVQHGFRVQEHPIIYTERRSGASKMSKKMILEAMYRPWVLRLRRMFTKSAKRNKVE